MTLPDFDPAFPLPIIAALAGLSVIFLILRAFRGRRMQPGWLQVPVVVLRLGTIALLALILLNPVRRVTRTTPESHSLILVDRSASMRLATDEDSTRWTDATDWTVQTLAAAGLPAPSLAVFSDEIQNVTDFTDLHPQGDETRLADALGELLWRGKEAPRDIVIVSDGRAHDRDQLALALTAARDLGSRISTKLVGTDTPPRNSWIAAVQAPRSVRPKAQVALHIELAATGLSSHEPLALVLREEDGPEVARSDFHPSADGGSVEKTLTFGIGLRTTRYTLELVPAADEVATDDNRFGFTVEVSSNKLRVLFVEGTHVKRTVGLEGHWWNDMELMTRAWDASGDIEYECLTPMSEYNDSPNLVGVTFHNGEMLPDPSKSFPATREELYRYDVMLISDVPVGNFSDEQMQWVVDWVNERGGGFLMGGGYTTFDVGHYDQTPWERITPVDMLAYGAGAMEKTFPIRIPDAVRHHPLWRFCENPEENERALDAHPVFTGMNRVKRAKPGAIVLAVRADAEGDEPVMAAQTYGRGRSIAWLPDPNGGWARDYITWGPRGGPPQGRHTELGHGYEFQFNADAARSPEAPEPPHPAPWYGNYWVNLVKWLGENSVRWHQDQLAGRAKASAAKPGELLPVAAEVLSVTKLDELLALDVGARLDLPGSPRVRLEYDRDEREFIGSLPVPADARGDQLTIYFDATTEQAAHTDTVAVGLRHSQLEFTETKPDAAFMEELAAAGAGRVLESPTDAVGWLAEVADERRRQAAVSWNQPLWPRWPLLALLLGLLFLEWALRRRSMISVTALLACLFTAPPSRAQDQAEIAALLEQLAAPRVRLRDEAEEKLAAMPEALPAIKELARSSPSAEARLRAENLLGNFTRTRWTLDATLAGHSDPAWRLWAMVLDAPGNKLYTRAEDGVRQWDLETLEPGPLLGKSLSTGDYWTQEAPLTSLALTPDGGMLISTNNQGNLIIDDPASGEVSTLSTSPLKPESRTLPDGTTETYFTLRSIPVVHLGFTPDGTLMTSNLDGHVQFWSLPDFKKLTDRAFDLPHIGHTFAFTPDGRHLIISLDRSGEPDHIQVRDWENNNVTCELSLPERVNSLRISRDGGHLLAALRNGWTYIWQLENGLLSHGQVIARAAGSSSCSIFSADEKSVFVANSDPDACVGEFELETGNPLWVHPPAGFGVHTLVLLPDGRLAGTCSDLKLRIWSRSDP